MNDIELMAYAEGVCFTRPWTADELQSCIDSGFGVYAVIPDTGYVIGRLSFDEAELYRIAVLPDKRRSGAGSELLRRFVSLCRQRGVAKIFLEVRSRNLPAVSLYEKSGFERISVRRGYYGDDDAVIYALTLG